MAKADTLIEERYCSYVDLINGTVNVNRFFDMLLGLSWRRYKANKIRAAREAERG